MIGTYSPLKEDVATSVYGLEAKKKPEHDKNTMQRRVYEDAHARGEHERTIVAYPRRYLPFITSGGDTIFMR